MKKERFFLFLFLFSAVFLYSQQNEKCLFFDDFKNLENWIYVKQPLVKNETKYSILNQSDWIEKRKTFELLQI